MSELMDNEIAKSESDGVSPIDSKNKYFFLDFLGFQRDRRRFLNYFRHSNLAGATPPNYDTSIYNMNTTKLYRTKYDAAGHCTDIIEIPACIFIEDDPKLMGLFQLDDGTYEFPSSLTSSKYNTYREKLIPNVIYLLSKEQGSKASITTREGKTFNNINDDYYECILTDVKWDETIMQYSLSWEMIGGLNGYITNIENNVDKTIITLSDGSKIELNDGYSPKVEIYRSAVAWGINYSNALATFANNSSTTFDVSNLDTLNIIPWWSSSTGEMNLEIKFYDSSNNLIKTDSKKLLCEQSIFYDNLDGYSYITISETTGYTVTGQVVYTDESEDSNAYYLKISYKNDEGNIVSLLTENLKGETGLNGSNGTSVSITSTTKNNGVTTVKFSDGSSININDGKDGTNGTNGTNGENGTSVSITSTNKVDGVTTITFSDGTTININDGKDGTNGINGETGEQGPKGDPGENGDSITIESTEKVDGVTTVTFSDGTSININDGKDGENGSSITIESTEKVDGVTTITFSDGTSIQIADGISTSSGEGTGTGITITSTTKNDGVTTVTFSDGTSININDGKDGTNGTNGTNGQDGTSIKIKSTNKIDGVTTVTFSDGTAIHVNDGLNGETGEQGPKGDPGENGTSVSITSTNKVDGVTTITFSDGSSININDGKDGTNGTNGTNGENGSSITIESTEKVDGVTTITFSDGTSININDGQDGNNGSLTIDSEMNDSSENAVQNKVIKAYVDNLIGDIQSVLSTLTTI